MLQEQQFDQIITDMIKKFGKEYQLTVCVEELSELQKECCKTIRGYKNKQAVIEELADVYICLQTIQEVCQVDMEDIIPVIKKKLLRTKQRYLEGSDTYET